MKHKILLTANLKCRFEKYHNCSDWQYYNS